MLVRLADLLERPAGEIAIAVALIFGGCGLSALKIVNAERITDAGLTLLARAMIGRLKSKPPEDTPEEKKANA